MEKMVIKNGKNHSLGTMCKIKHASQFRIKPRKCKKYWIMD